MCNAIVNKDLVYKYIFVAYKFTERHFHYLSNLNLIS